MGWYLYLWNTFSRQNRAFSTFKLDWVTTLTTPMAPCIAEHFQYLLNWQILVKMNILYCFKRCSVHFWLVVVADNGCDKAVFVGLNKILMVTMNRTCHSWGCFPKLAAFLTISPHNTTFFCASYHRNLSTILLSGCFFVANYPCRSQLLTSYECSKQNTKKRIARNALINDHPLYICVCISIDCISYEYLYLGQAYLCSIVHREEWLRSTKRW